MGELLKSSSTAQREWRNPSSIVAEVLSKAGLELLGEPLNLRCRACGCRWKVEKLGSHEFWWICPQLCNAG